MALGANNDPRAIRNASLPKSLRGFDEMATRRLLNEVAGVIESLTAERDGLRRHIESLQAAPAPEGQFSAPPQPEAEDPVTLGNAILAAKRAGEELLSAAKEEAAQTLASARAEAERLVEDARSSTNDQKRELSEQRAALERDRDEHKRAVSQWSAKIEAEREAAIAQAWQETEERLAAGERRLAELKEQQEELHRSMAERQSQFVGMLHSAIEQLTPPAPDESEIGDLPDALQERAGSVTRQEEGDLTPSAPPS